MPTAIEGLPGLSNQQPVAVAPALGGELLRQPCRQAATFFTWEFQGAALGGVSKKQPQNQRSLFNLSRPGSFQGRDHPSPIQSGPGRAHACPPMPCGTLPASILCTSQMPCQKCTPARAKRHTSSQLTCSFTRSLLQHVSGTRWRGLRPQPALRRHVDAGGAFIAWVARAKSTVRNKCLFVQFSGSTLPPQNNG